MSCGWGKYEKQEGDILGSPSRLICFREDPEIYKARYIDKEMEETASMEWGTLVHCAVWEPEKFLERYLILPEKTPGNSLSGDQLEARCKELALKTTGTKAAKIARIREVTPLEKQYDELVDELPEGKIMIPPKSMKSALYIAAKIHSHPKVGPWVKAAIKERRGWYTCQITGVVMRFQIDGSVEHKGIGVLMDLKITKDWRKRDFERNMYKNGLHVQFSSYREGYKQNEGKTFGAFLIIAVEPSWPHRIRYHQIEEATIDAGDVELKVLLPEYKDRLIRNDFSPRVEDQEISTVGLASWDWERINKLEESNE